MENDRKWKQVPCFEGLYDLRDDGLLYSYPRETTKGGYTYGRSVGKGYLKHSLSKNGVVKNERVNRLVWKTFVGDIPDGYDVHHKNHNPSDNRVENLELIECHKHSKMHLDEMPNKMIKETQKPVLQLTLDGQFVAEYPSIAEAARQTGTYTSNICKCIKGIRNKAGGFIWKFKEAA